MGQYFSKLRVLLRKLRMFGEIFATSAADFVLDALRIPAIKSIAAEEKPVMIYLGGNLPARIARMIKWHKRHENFFAVLVCHKDGYTDKYVNPSLDRVILFRNRFHLKRILKGLRGARLIHAFGPKSYYPAAAKRWSRIPFVYDMQDVLAVYYGLHPPIRWYRNELPHEKYVLKYCDGFVSHSMEVQEAFRLYQINSKPETLFFPLCCDDDVFETKKGNFDAEEFHVVYAGEVAGSFRDSRQFATIQFHYLAGEFAKQKIHLHLYPAPGTFADDKHEYKKMAETNRFLHVHEPVHQSALARELSQYDFGLIPFFYRDTIHSREKFRYSTSLKLFNYIEAGIPVISTKDIDFQSWITARYGMGIIIEKNDIPVLKSIVKRTDYRLLLRNVEDNRKKISLNHHIIRLMEFYNRVSGK